NGLERLEAAWKARAAGGDPPRWADFLPAGLIDPDEALCLLQIDVEFRARAGLPGLLSEPYFDKVPLDADREAELIRWEYQQRWKHDRRARVRDYAAAFPRHAAALQGLAPRRDCPACGASMPCDEESDLTLRCPECSGVPPTRALGPMPFPEPAGGIDLRRHELLDAVGAGGMGEVYRTRDLPLGRDLALKVLRPAFARDRAAERRFLREARITAGLQHPGIVPVHNLGRLADGRLFFTMKLVRGQTLHQLLRDKAAGLLSVFERVCEAVGYAHGQGVIHRDLKPANIMVGAFGEVQVMDWGLANRGHKPTEEASAGLAADEDDSTQAGTVMGTPAYMPPEQARGEPLDERADVFALGAILCETLTGEPPFAGDALARSRAGDLRECFARLDACGADPG
ncbi:MAG: serine/threonine protein kinase, partial [Thermoleophilia bacterium]|nr:serine/threonine protein kinase [Thermoleophilia bacterium]